MKYLTLILLLFLLPQVEMKAQNCVDTVFLSLDYSFEGADLIADIKVKNFKDIIGFQFGIYYDNDDLEFISASSELPFFNAASYFNGPKGEIRVVWIDQINIGQDIDDNMTLMKLKFNPKRASSSSVITISEKSLPIEFVNINSNVLCFSGDNITVSTNPGFISGRLLHDENNNCIQDATESGLKNWLIEITKDNKKYYRNTDANGNYTFGAAAGNYSIQVVPKNELWQSCSAPINVSLIEGDTKEVNFLASPIIECAKMYTDISTPFLRRCFDNTYTITYENQGTITAENATIEVDFDDNLTFINATNSNFTLNGNKLLFNLGNIAVNASGRMDVIFNLNCQTTELGETHCVSATIFPNDPCSIPANWSGSELEVTSECDLVNQKVRFTIQNVGVGDMTTTTNYIVTEDDILKPTPPIKLDADVSVNFECPANGSTYRLTTKQEAGFPGLSHPSIALEGCGTDINGNFSKGFVNLFEEDDRDGFVDVDCQQSIGSYDPNDIQGNPIGYSQKRFIEKEIMPEYKIRFQNTGTDTAFTVLIKNYIPENLDLTSLEMGSSSHEYSYSINLDRELVVKFAQIKLVDSTKNEPKSHGFVKYKIRPLSTLQDDDVINNNARIYFDFNAPISTNTTFYTIGREFILTGTEWFGAPIDVKFYPNPTQTDLIIEYFELEQTSGLQYILRNNRGDVIQKNQILGTKTVIPVADLPAGNYYIELISNGTKKLVKSFIKC